MKRILSFLVLLCVGIFAHAQYVFHAEFRSLVDGERIMYAKIANVNGDSRLTNSDGYVSIPYSEGSKFTVTHLSFDTIQINPFAYKTGDTILFYMTPRVFHLKEFTYSILGPRHTFDNRFVKTDLGKSDIDKVKERLEIEDMTADLVALDRSAQDGMVLGSPITALYEQFSKAGKERRKYAQLLANDFRDSLTRIKYNLNVVQSLIAFPSMPETQDFMDFCSFDQRYIEQTERVDIYMEILRCRDEYLQLED
ncbi:MAG: hypothetical protein JXR19_10160 [Bacteroidia bacterium]